MLQAGSDAVIAIASVLQDPPVLIKEFIWKWVQGYKVVLGIKTQSKESAAMFLIRIFLIEKFVFWDQFPLGIAPLVIGLFFFASVQLFFLGIIGEYIGSIHSQVLKRPLVIEKERINID